MLHTIPAADHATTPRHDGWSGARKVAFLENLIELGVASRALKAVGKGPSGLYAMRARDPAFEAAWDAARLMVRENLFDTLIGQAFEGEEHVVVRDEGETRHQKRNYRLGMGMLDRLTGFTPVELAPLFARHFEEVCAMIAADADVREWRNWLDAVDPTFAFYQARDLFPLPEESADFEPDFEVWEDVPGVYRTNMPPPPEFAGLQMGSFGDKDYERALTDHETDRHLARLAEDDDTPEADDLADKLLRGRAAWDAYFGDADDVLTEGDAVIEYKAMDAPRPRPARRASRSAARTRQSDPRRVDRGELSQAAKRPRRR